MAAKKGVAMLVAVSLLVAAMHAGAAAADSTCDAGQLASCLPAIVSGSAPTATCCSNLRGQQGCLCQYKKDPKFGKYMGNAPRVLKACAITMPNC